MGYSGNPATFQHENESFKEKDNNMMIDENEPVRNDRTDESTAPVTTGSTDIPLLSILIPVYNEQAYLAKIIDRVMNAPTGDVSLRKEIVLVNDASTDRTAEVIEALLAKYPETIRAFHQPKNQGKGAAIRMAIEKMQGDYAIIQDADLEYDPNEYPIVLKPLLAGLADAVYGSRFATREMRKVLFYHHKLGNLFLTHLSNLTTGLDLTDMETCYKAFRGEVIKSIPLRSNRFGIEPEITAKIAKRRLVVYEVPISYHGRRYSEGKKIGWKDGVSAIRTILKYWLTDDCWFDPKDNPDRVFRMEQARNYIGLLVKKTLPWYGMSILELCASSGNISKQIPQRERLTLTDPSDEKVRILKNLYEGNAVVEVRKFNPETEEGLDALQEKFDTVLLFNELENVENDLETIRTAAKTVGPNGRVIIVTAGECGLLRKLGTFAGVKRRYTKKQLRTLISQTGLTLETCRSFNSLGGCFLRMKRLFSFGKSDGSGGLSLKIFNTLLPWFRPLDWFFPGANIVVVAKKAADHR